MSLWILSITVHCTDKIDRLSDKNNIQFNNFCKGNLLKKTKKSSKWNKRQAPLQIIKSPLHIFTKFTTCNSHININGL